MVTCGGLQVGTSVLRGVRRGSKDQPYTTQPHGFANRSSPPEAMAPRTVLILTAEPPEQLGGAEHFIRMLHACLESRNYQVEVIHRGNCGLPWKRRSQTRYVAYIQDVLLGYFVGRRARKRVQENGYRIAAAITDGLIGWYPLQRAVHQVHMYHGTYRGQVEAIRLLISKSGYLKLKWWDSMVLERASGRGKLVLCNSDQTASEVQQYFGWDTRTIWLPLDTNHFQSIDQLNCRRALGLPTTGPIGLFVGNTQPTKRFEIVLSLIHQLPEIHWVLALRGGAPKELSSRSGLNIYSDVTYDRMPALYNSADFSLCPSRYDSFGYVVAESLACGTPVIATPGGASQLFLRESPLRELLISDGSNPEPFLAAIRNLLLNPSLYRDAVLRDARPVIKTLMSCQNWCTRFAEISRL